MRDLISVLVFLAVWWILQAFVLPRFGVGT